MGRVYSMSGKRITVGILCMLVLAAGGVAATPIMPEAATDVGVWQCWNPGNPNPCDYALTSVTLTSATDGWAIGERGIILHWNGDAWSRVGSPTTTDLSSVAMVAANDG